MPSLRSAQPERKNSLEPERRVGNRVLDLTTQPFAFANLSRKLGGQFERALQGNEFGNGHVWRGRISPLLRALEERGRLDDCAKRSERRRRFYRVHDARVGGSRMDVSVSDHERPDALQGAPNLD